MLKFPPVEDVHILVSMALSYQERMQGKDSKPILASQPQDPKPVTLFQSTPKQITLTTPSQILSSSSKLSFSQPLSNPVQSSTPTANKSPFRLDKPSQPSQPAPSKPFITPSDITQSSVPTFSDPLSKKPEPPKPVNKGFSIKPEFKASSPMRGPEAYVRKEEDKKEEKKEERKEEKKEEKKVLARSENSFVEKCNTALLLLLEQSDE